MTRPSLLRLIAAIGLAASMACEQGPTGSIDRAAVALQAADKKLDVEVCAPGQGGFSIVSTNPFFPLDVGSQWTYEGEEDGEPLEVIISVLDQTRPIGGVTTRVVEEREFEDGELVEVSWNYFVEAEDGTVCYHGEDVDEFDDGEIVHEGAWCADEAGNAPGIIMPADPKPGMKYANEVAPGIAEDEAKIVGSGPVTVPFGRFTETIRIREFNPLDDEKGYKVYASGIGLIVDETLELVDFKDSAAPPAGPIPTDQTCGI